MYTTQVCDTQFMYTIIYQNIASVIENALMNTKYRKWQYKIYNIQINYNTKYKIYKQILLTIISQCNYIVY